MKNNFIDAFDDSTSNKVSQSSSQKHHESCSKFISMLFKAKEDAHISHIEQRVKSSASHEALGMFYDALDGLLDTFAETVMAVHGQLTLSFQASGISNLVSYFEGLYKQVESAKSMFKETWILNQVDEMSQLIAHTLYRLKYVTAAPAQ
jgi:hypothetical protein